VLLRANQVSCETKQLPYGFSSQRGLRIIFGMP
jgi:hypothetical protein